MVAAAPALDREASDVELCALLARPMAGAVRLALTRSPSPRAASAVEGDRFRLATVRDPRKGELVGMGVRTVRDVFFDGQPSRVGYLGQLRVVGKVGFGRWREGFRELLAGRADDELNFDLTTIASDNVAARRLLERGLPGLPAYQDIGEIVTSVFAPARRAQLVARQATLEDLPAIVERLESDRRYFQLAPRWSLQDLAPGGRCRDLALDDFLVVDGKAGLRGCVALWDQRAFKQVVIAGYAPWLAVLRPLVNVLLGLRGEPRLPRPAKTLALSYLSHFSADDAETARALIESAFFVARRRGLEQLSLSLSTGHPLLSSIDRPARRYLTRLYAVGANPADLEVLRRGPFHLEGATL